MRNAANKGRVVLVLALLAQVIPEVLTICHVLSWTVQNKINIVIVCGENRF